MCAINKYTGLVASLLNYESKFLLSAFGDDANGHSLELEFAVTVSIQSYICVNRQTSVAGNNGFT